MIREARKDEWGKLKELYLTLLKNDPEAFVDEYVVVKERVEDEWEHFFSIKDGTTFVSEEDSRLVGMGQVNFYQTLPGLPVLHKLGVLPKYRGRGIAKQLIKARENWAQEKGAERIRTYVIASRNSTLELFKRVGYEKKELLKNNAQRSNGTYVDVIVLEKTLN